MTDRESRPRIRRAARRTFAISVAIALALSSAACATPEEQAEPAREVRVALPIDVKSLDPQLTGAALDGSVLVHLYDGLFNLSPDGQIVPALATGMNASDDAMTYTITLRDGVKFHDGAPMTSADVKFSLDRVRDPNVAAPYASDFESIATVDAPDEHTVVLHMKDRDPLIQNKLIGVGAMVLPRAYFDKVGVDGFLKHPIGTGPFRFESRTPSQQIVLSAFPDFWGDKPPPVDRLIYTIAPETATRLALLESGEVDIATNLDTSVKDRLDADRFTVVGADTGAVLFVYPDQKDPRLGNPAVVKALNYAINRTAIVDSVLNGFAAPLGAMIPPGLPGFTDAIVDPYPYDPALAKQLLATSKADFTEPIDFDIPAERWPNIAEFSQAIVADLEKVGVKLRLHVLDYTRYLERNEQHTISPMFIDNISSRTRDMVNGIIGSFSCGQLYSYYCNPDFDQVLHHVNELTGEQRLTATKALMQRIHDDPPAVLLWEPKTVIGMNSRIQWTPTPASETINLRSVQVT